MALIVIIVLSVNIIMIIIMALIIIIIMRYGHHHEAPTHLPPKNRSNPGPLKNLKLPRKYQMIKALWDSMGHGMSDSGPRDNTTNPDRMRVPKP